MNTILEKKTCLHCQSIFDITDRDLQFYTKISPTFVNPSTFGTSPGQGSTKFMIPTPTLCPDCRQRRRLSFRNERNLYKRKCDASGKDIISIYSPDKPYKVYDQKIRWSDARNPMAYAKEFDFGKTFSENFGALMQEVPRYNLYNFDNENSEYVQYLPHSKNCYLVFGGRYCSDCYYGGTLLECNDCIDCLYTEKCQHCYECIDCLNCSGCSYCFDCSECGFSYGLTHCKGCQFCYDCHDLTNQKYCVRNKQYSKEEYMRLISEQQLTQSWSKRIIEQRNIQENCENCVGNFLYNSKNIYQSQQIWSSEDINYATRAVEQKDSMDLFGCAKGSLIYDSLCCDYSMQCISGLDSEYCQQSYYYDHCFHSNNIFGCIAVRNASYCIFNKQYTKEAYEKTVAKIIAHMIETGERGEFFHPSLSPFGYNETVAQEYYPIEKLNYDYSKFGYSRSDYQAPTSVADKVLDGKDTPEKISEVTEDILKTAIRCEVTGKLFRIIPQELAFYRKHNIPLPRKHPDQRHKERMELRK